MKFCPCLVWRKLRQCCDEWITGECMISQISSERNWNEWLKVWCYVILLLVLREFTLDYFTHMYAADIASVSFDIYILYQFIYSET